MKTVGIKATFNEVYVNPETKSSFHMFTTDDFCETVPIRSDYVKIKLDPGDRVRLDFQAIAFINDKGKTDCFLATKVVGKLC